MRLRLVAALLSCSLPTVRPTSQFGFSTAELLRRDRVTATEGETEETAGSWTTTTQYGGNFDFNWDSLDTKATHFIAELTTFTLYQTCSRNRTECLATFLYKSMVDVNSQDLLQPWERWGGADEYGDGAGPAGSRDQHLAGTELRAGGGGLQQAVRSHQHPPRARHQSVQIQMFPDHRIVN